MINLNNKTVVATEFLEKKTQHFEGKLNSILTWIKKKKGSLKNATLWIKTITREYILGNHFSR